MRLSDARLRQRQTTALDPNHRLPPRLAEDAPRDRSNRLLEGAYRQLVLTMRSHRNRDPKTQSSRTRARRDRLTRQCDPKREFPLRPPDVLQPFLHAPGWDRFAAPQNRGALESSACCNLASGMMIRRRGYQAPSAAGISGMRRLSTRHRFGQSASRPSNPKQSNKTRLRESGCRHQYWQGVAESRLARPLTKRLSDAGLHRRPTKLIYPDHQTTPWLSGDFAPRSLAPIVRCVREH
jgi:hypothetical protein